MSNEILFLAHRIPFPADRGDKIRSHHILRRLARMAPVHVACFADDDKDMAEEVELAALAHTYRLTRRAKSLAVAGMQALAQGRPVSLTAFHDACIAAYVKQTLATGRIGTIYVFSGQMAQYVPDDFGGRVVLDLVDVDSAKFDAYGLAGSGPMGWVHAREGRLLRSYEARCALRADVTLLISDKEAQLFRSRLSALELAGTDVQVVGNGIDADHYDPALVSPEHRLQAMARPRLIFTGQMDYPPNIAAVDRVARRLMPAIREACPDASFHIVGRAPTEAVRVLSAIEGVHVWGRVDDVRCWLKAADIALAPLEIARGVQNKVLEAMAMELPVVLTNAAATGIPATAGHHFAVADSDADLIAQVVRLARDQRAATVMGLDARRLVLERQSWQTALAPLAGILSSRPRVLSDAA
ncbi:MAG TPA: TIGR03087 family PEP-CTERM/XrtA system glycosyltransferase [Novosphingobium sp.]|nr:TIGR03087 family PEP-CTERM/XrtA system glycosyltransferase [Novosphingobium sp.]